MSTASRVAAAAKPSAGTAHITAARALRPVNASNQLLAKLRVESASDPLEREADRAAAAVLADGHVPPLRGTARSAQRKTASQNDETGGPAAAISSAAAAPQWGHGRTLPAPTLGYFEPRFGESFSDVRIHTDGPASIFATAIGARAFAIGRDIGFAPGEYAPTSVYGRSLIAHELAHVVQQRGGAEGGVIRRSLQNEALYRSISPTELQGMSKAQLESLYQALHAIILEHQNTSWAEQDGARDNLATIREALLDKAEEPPPPPAKPKPPLIPGMKGADDATMLRTAGGILDNVQTMGSDINQIELEGQTYEISDQTLADIRGKVAVAINDALGKARRDASYAIDGYETQSEIDREHWIVSRIVKTFGMIEDPGPVLRDMVRAANMNVVIAKTAIKANNFSLAAERLAAAETSARRAKLMYQAYWEDIISAGEFTIKVLEYTQTAAFITLAVLATVVTAGAAAGVASVGSVGLGAAGTANLIAAGAPVVAKLGEAGVKLAIGDKVDWGDLVIDVAFTIVMYKFGGALAGKIGGRLIGSNPAARSLGRHAVAGIVSGVIVGRGASVAQIAIKAVYEKLSGNPVTWNSFLDQVAAMMLDPKQAALDLILGAIGSYGAAKGRARGGTPPGAGKDGKTPPSAPTEPSSPPQQQESVPAAKPITPATVKQAAAAEPTPPAVVKPAAEPVAKPPPIERAAPAGELPTQAKRPQPVEAPAPSKTPTPSETPTPVERPAAARRPAAEQAAEPAAARPARPRTEAPDTRSNAELIAAAESASAQLKGAKTSPQGISPGELNAAEAAIKSLRRRQDSAPDPAVQKALETATENYHATVHKEAYVGVRVAESGVPETSSGMIPGQRAATPREAFETVAGDRGFQNSVPVHQIENTRQRIAALETVKNPSKKEQLELGRLRRELAISVPGTGGGPAGPGYNTHAVIQVIDADGNLVAFARGKFTGGPHAEEIAIADLRQRLSGVDTRGAKVQVVGDQVVCTDVCRPSLQKFAQDIGASEIEGFTYHRPTVTGAGQTSAKTTARTLTHESIQEKVAPRLAEGQLTERRLPIPVREGETP